VTDYIKGECPRCERRYSAVKVLAGFAWCPWCDKTLRTPSEGAP